MATMKKMIFAALATATVLGQVNSAFAVGGKDIRPEGVRKIEIERIAKDTKAKSGTAAREAAELTRQLENTGIRLLPEQNRKLQEVISEDATGEIKKQVTAIASSKDPQLAELNAAQLEAISNLKGIKRDAATDAIAQMSDSARAEQSYVAMATSAATQAKGWAPEVRSNFEFLLKSANARIARGESRGEALLAAAKDLEQQRKVKVNVDDIIRLCK